MQGTQFGALHGRGIVHRALLSATPCLPRDCICRIIALLTLLTVVPVAAQDWSPELLPPRDVHRTPDEPIVLRIPPEVPLEVLQRLALELNTIDITRLVAREGDLAFVSLPEPLAPGSHLLRLVEYGEDGSILERGAWTLEIRKSAAFREYAMDADVSATGLQRIRDGGLTTSASRLALQGGANVDARAADEDWEVALAANSIFDNERSRTMTGRNIDLGEYQLQGIYHFDDASASVVAGHQQIGHGSLIMRDFYRRGISGSMTSSTLGAEVTAFALRTDPIVGVSDFTGINNPETRIQGFSMSSYVPGMDDNVIVSSQFYTGESRQSGFAVGGFTESTHGRGWSIAADSLWLDRRLRLRGEYAASSVDFDGGGPVPREADHAYALLASYAPYQNETVAETPINWRLTMQHERIGTFFASLANPALVPDRESTVLMSDLFWGNLSVQAQAGFQTDNVEDLAALPRHRILNGHINTYYAPTISYRDDGSLPWYGQPSVNMLLHYTDIKQIDTPAAFLGFQTKNRSRGFTLGGGSSYQRWNWNLSHTLALFDDDAGFASDTRSNLTNLTLYFMPHARVTLNTYVQWDHFVDRTFDRVTDSLHTGVGTSITWIRNRLLSNFNYSMNRARGFDDIPTVHHVSGETLWYFMPERRSGLRPALSISGSYQNDVFGPHDSIYQVFVGLKLSSQMRY